MRLSGLRTGESQSVPEEQPPKGKRPFLVEPELVGPACKLPAPSIDRVGRPKRAKGGAAAQYDKAPWWMKAVTYQILVRSFMDSNGDGVGDLDGVRKKLDYLQWLGVDCIWLNPFLTSPLKDDGYDVSDYFSILPQYGNLKSLELLIEEAHKRGMKLLMDVAVNHTSDQHPWFQRAVQAPKGSPYRDWYVWSDTDKKYSDARIIFVDTEKSNWTYQPDAKQYYWHRFFHHQPDLNYDNEDVQKAICDVFGFWIDKGVDGFRLDAIPYLIEREGTNCENLDETHSFVKRLRKYIDDKSPNRPIALLAEANQPREDVIKYFGNGDECHLAYDFNLMPEIYSAFAAGSAKGFAGKSHGLAQVLSDKPELPENCIMPGFLRNHDELTLEMVTEPVKKEMYAAYAQDPRARRNVGIGRRLAPLLGNDPQKLRLAQALLLSLDSPVMYYGDEIGMGDDLEQPDRHPVRTPMQWNAEPNGGFSVAKPDRLAAHVVRTKGFTPKDINVQSQLADQDSLLRYVQNLLAVRRSRPEMALGKMQVMDVGNEDVLAFTRTLGRRRAVCLFNFSNTKQDVYLDTRTIKGNRLKDLLAGGSPLPKPDGVGIIHLELDPLQPMWLGVGQAKLDQARPTG
jgi:maltose alpha-D-glucosyltransferase / alpha-amylase